MRGKNKYLLCRDGRYFSRIPVPLSLRPYIKKTELRTALGADRRIALREHPIAVAKLMLIITQAEREKHEAEGLPVSLGRYPLTDGEIALRNYHDRLAQDESARNQTAGYAQVAIDDGYVQSLREGVAGKLNDAALVELVGHRIERFQSIGNTVAAIGSQEWRTLARAICISEYEALERLLERDEGDYTGEPKHPLLKVTAPVVDELAPVSLQGLFRDYIASRLRLGKGSEAGRRWAPVFRNLNKFLGHDDARRVTKQNIMKWRDDLLLTRMPKTVSDVHLAAVRTVFNWAVREDRLDENPAENVRQEVAVRRQGFWNQWQAKLRECSAHLVGFIMRRAGGDASGAFRASFV